MGRFISAKCCKTRNQAKEFIFSIQMTFTLEIGLTTLWMDMGAISLVQGKFMKDSLKKASKKGMVNVFIKTEKSMKVLG